MKRGQTALEYLFIIGASLILVSMTLKVVLNAIKSINGSVSDYIRIVRNKLIENL